MVLWHNVLILLPFAILMVAVKTLGEELKVLHEPGSYVGEVVKVMGKSKVLVKVHILCFLAFS